MPRRETGQQYVGHSTGFIHPDPDGIAAKDASRGPDVRLLASYIQWLERCMRLDLLRGAMRLAFVPHGTAAPDATNRRL